MGVEGAAVQVEADGRVRYRASALGACTKMLVAARMGYEMIEPQGEKALKVVETMNSGHDAEDEVVRRLEAEGKVINGRDALIEFAITGKVSIRGHVDGWERTSNMFLEIKSMNDEAWRGFHGPDGLSQNWSHGFWPRNLWQISAYLVATGIPCLLVTYNRDTEEIRKTILDGPKYDLAAIRARILGVEAAARNYALPPTCDTPMFPCPVFYMHESDRLEFEEGDDLIVQGLAEAYEKARGERDDAEKRYKAAQKALLRAVGETGKFETLQGWKVTKYDPGKGALDREKVEAFVKAHGGNIDDLKQMGIRVMPPKKGEEG